MYRGTLVNQVNSFVVCYLRRSLRIHSFHHNWYDFDIQYTSLLSSFWFNHEHTLQFIMLIFLDISLITLVTVTFWISSFTEIQNKSGKCILSIKTIILSSCRASEMSLSPSQTTLQSSHWISNSLSIPIKINHNQLSSANRTPSTGLWGGDHTFACTYFNQYISVINSFVLYGFQSSSSVLIRRKGKLG